MEEVDGIIIQTLKQLGCDLSEEIVSLKDFSPNMVVEAASRCLHTINEDLNFPFSLPTSMSARFRVGTSLASACQDLGYGGDIGYQTFLYSNEHELRRVYMFLLEKLPKESAQTSDEPMGTAVLLNRQIAQEIKRQLLLTWTPPAFLGAHKRSKGSSSPLKGYAARHSFTTIPITLATRYSQAGTSNAALRRYGAEFYKTVSQQPAHAQVVAASVLEHHALQAATASEWENEWNSTGLASRLSQEEYRKQKRLKLLSRIRKDLQESVQRVDASVASGKAIEEMLTHAASGNRKQPKGSRFTHAEQLLFSKDEDESSVAMSTNNRDQMASSEEERRKLREDEIAGLKERLLQLNQKLEEMRLSSKQAGNALSEIGEEDTSLETRIKEHEEMCRVKRKTLDLLPDAAQNIAKLEQLVQSSSQRLVNLAAQWEKHRAPLISQYRELKALNEVKESEFEQRIKEVKSTREKMREVADEVRVKEELYKQLVAESSGLGKESNRAVYTRRILEIVANIKRQRQDIDKVLLDTRALQKDINSLAGKLDRTFTVTDELIFKDAKRDEFNRKSYKLLANLHESFEVLVRTVEETGVIMREIRDLEDQLDGIRQSEDQESNAQLVRDLKEMKQENATIVARLKVLQ